MRKRSSTSDLKVQAGLAAFTQGNFYEAHEFFEDAWRDSLDESREFYRALLHISGGFYRLTQSRNEAAKKFFLHAHKWLVQFPSPYRGVTTSRLQEYMLYIIDDIENKSHPVQIHTYQADLVHLLAPLR